MKRVLVRWEESVERSGVYRMDDSEYAEFEEWCTTSAHLNDEHDEMLRRFLKAKDDGPDGWRESVRHETFEDYNGHILISARVAEGD